MDLDAKRRIDRYADEIDIDRARRLALGEILPPRAISTAAEASARKAAANKRRGAAVRRYNERRRSFEIMARTNDWYGQARYTAWRMFVESTFDSAWDWRQALSQSDVKRIELSEIVTVLGDLL